MRVDHAAHSLPVLPPEGRVDLDKVIDSPAVDGEVGQVGLAVLGRSHEVHGCPPSFSQYQVGGWI